MIIDKVHSRCFGVINKPKQNPAMEGHLSNFRLNNAPIDTFGSLVFVFFHFNFNYSMKYLFILQFILLGLSVGGFKTHVCTCAWVCVSLLSPVPLNIALSM